MTWKFLACHPSQVPPSPALPLLKAGAGESLPARPARHSERKKEPRGGGSAGRGGEPGLEDSREATAATAAGVCASRGAGPGGRVSRCRSWRCRRWWSTPGAAQWWIISIGERAARGGLPGPAAPPLLSHGRVGYGGGRRGC